MKNNFTFNVIEHSASNYFQYSGIDHRILKYFRVEIINDGSSKLEIKYPYADGSIKTCRPFSEKKWSFSTSVSDNDQPRIFGIDRIPPKGELLVIAAGEKDMLSISSLGIPAICFSSETVIPSEAVISQLKKNFDVVIILYDQDDTGNKYAYKYSKEFDIPVGYIPLQKGIKDVTDYLASGASKSDLMLIINKGISSFYRSLTTFNAGLLKKMKFNELDYILPGILPIDAFCALVGGSDSGKSLISLQFAISFILKKKFLGLQVNGGGKVLYFSFEDSGGSLAGRYEKLISNLHSEEKALVNKNLTFKIENKSVDQQIDSHMIENPETRLVIIDTFAELALGRDINYVSVVREILAPLRKICIKYQLAIIIIHHIGKSAEKEGVMSKTAVNGSQTFEAAMRMVVQMNKHKNHFELGITKGNDIPERMKASNSKTYLTHDHGTLQFSKSEKPIKINILKPKNVECTDWSKVFRNDSHLKYSEIKKRLMDSGVPESTTEKWIKKDLTKFKTKDGTYVNSNLHTPGNEGDDEEHFKL